MDSQQILARRMHRQRLAGQPFTTVEDAVRALTAVQAQDFVGAKWGLGQRVRKATDVSIEEAYNDGRILRTHVMRPTWHFVTPDDIRWMEELTAPRVRALLAYYDRKLEIDRKVLGRCAKILVKFLRDGNYRTRAEIGRAYGAAGIEASGQRLAHLVMHAELDALICSGPMRGKQITYALLDERAPHARRLARDEALAELTQRFFASHGPAEAKDFVFWSGLTAADVKRGLESVSPPLDLAVIEGRDFYFTHATALKMPKAPHVRLLPNYDEYLIAYRNNTQALDADNRPFFTNDALAAHFVTIDGRVGGGWRRRVDAKTIAITVSLFRRLSLAETAALDREFRRYGVFIGRPITVRGV